MTALVLGSAVAAMADNSVTFATFADPSGSAHNPVFVHDRGAKTLSGAWGNAGLTLIAPGAVGAPTVTNAKFNTTTLALTQVIPGLFATGPGSISFSDSSNNPLFTISFDSATFVEGLGAGASTLRGQNITLSGPLVPPGTTMTQFNFALANQQRRAGTRHHGRSGCGPARAGSSPTPSLNQPWNSSSPSCLIGKGGSCSQNP
jgi:hypothetical protein